MQRLLILLAIIGSVGAIQPTAKAQSCSCEVSNRKEQAYDQLLLLSATEQAAAVSRHLPLGAPSGPANATNESLLVQDYYVINHDADLRVPIWVAYRLREIDLLIGRPRTECFRRDVRLQATEAAICQDYDEPVFDRGHMVPNADMVRNESAMINTYMFSNMTPQHDRFNRGIWSRLEGYVRDWPRLKGEIYVITGSVFDRVAPQGRDPDASATQMQSNNGNTRVAVPSHFYKIVHHTNPDGEIETITILLPHLDQSFGNQTDQVLANSITTINQIEALTGINIFPSFAQAHPTEAAAMKSTVAPALWPTN